MTKRLDTPPIIPSQPQNDPLSNKLMEILKERHALQLRTQELERMVKQFLSFCFSSFEYTFILM
jgi:hypothetical protein